MQEDINKRERSTQPLRLIFCKGCVSPIGIQCAVCAFYVNVSWWHNYRWTRIRRVTEDSKCLNKNHVLYEKQFPLLVHTCTHVFRFYNNTTLLERNYILCSELQRVAECWRNGQQMGRSEEFRAIYRIRRPGLPLSLALSTICGGHNRTGTCSLTA